MKNGLKGRAVSMPVRLMESGSGRSDSAADGRRGGVRQLESVMGRVRVGRWLKGDSEYRGRVLRFFVILSISESFLQ